MTALNYEIWGPTDAPTLMFSGSLGTDLSMWEPQRVLADEYRLILVDNRGHGGSPSPAGPYTIADLGSDVLELLDTLAIERVGFVGLSIGGMIGLWLAAQAPARLTGLVCLCSAAHVPNGDAYRERAATVRAAGSAAAVADGIVAKWLTMEFAVTHPQLRARLVEMVSTADPEGYASCAEAVAGFDLRSELGQIPVRTLVVSGAQDDALGVPLQAEIAAAVPGARHVILDPGAHIVSLERADAVNELIGEHLT